ncbi:hypothetical protein [Paraflavitalea speifideaquila]|uniref:hypothetical protein n=1 Tax=Paraflavitalea speifideaquila TaxID=3076558 RepID=UPI0028F130F7|nr:hypothetical protein [Paraflavitalea speifideiaquila]
MIDQALPGMGKGVLLQDFACVPKAYVNGVSVSRIDVAYQQGGTNACINVLMI